MSRRVKNDRDGTGSESRKKKLPVHLKLDGHLVERLRIFADEKHTTQTYIIEAALERLFDDLDGGGQLPLFPKLK
jgi:hypothetical protein